MTEEDLAELEARWHRAMAKNPQPRILDPLPWRTRLRLAAEHAVDVIGCWLCDHRCPELAVWLWKACGMW